MKEWSELSVGSRDVCSYTEYWRVDSGQRLKTTTAPTFTLLHFEISRGFEVEMSEERGKSKDK